MHRSEENFGFEYEPRQSSRYSAKKINDLDYPDDIALLESSIAMANEQILKLRNVARQVGLEINIEKTEYMTFNIASTEKLKLDDVEIKRVENFKYLGAMMVSTSSDFKKPKIAGLDCF
jgi:hypothetical protein